MGVQLSRTFAAVDDGTRLDRALTRLFPEHSRSFLAKLIDDGRVLIDGRLATKTSARVTAGASVQVDLPPPSPTEIVSQDLPLKILFEDEDLVVIDKPAGLVVHPAAGHADRTLVNALLFHVKDLSGIGGELRPGIVHRLDKDTSGVMVIAKNDAVHRALTSAWPKVKKEYLAIVYGKPKRDRGSVDAPIGRDPRNRKRMAVVRSGGRAAVTDYVVEKSLKYVSLLRCTLRSGRTHQIRVHLTHLGFPIAGDDKYGDFELNRGLAKQGLKRMFLHAGELEFGHPLSGKALKLHAPLPEDLSRFLDSLGT